MISTVCLMRRNIEREITLHFENTKQEAFIKEIDISESGEMGITGRMLRWIMNFLSARTAKCHVQADKTEPLFSTSMGLKAAYCYQSFFNVFTKDMYENADHFKFAYDGTM